MPRASVLSLAAVPLREPSYAGQLITGFQKNAAPVDLSDAGLVVIASVTIVAPIPASFIVDASAEIDAGPDASQTLTVSIRVDGGIVDTVNVTAAALSKTVVTRPVKTDKLVTGGHTIELVAQCDAGHVAQVPAGRGSVRAFMQTGPF